MSPFTYLPLATNDNTDGVSRFSPRGPFKQCSRMTLVVVFALAGIVLFTFDIVYINLPRTRNPFAYSHSHTPTALESFMNHLYPVGMPNRTNNWENENSKTMQKLITCIEQDTCSENQTSIVLMSSYRYANSINGGVAGEEIWAASVLLSLRDMGYTAIFAPDNYELARTYRLYPDLVKVVLLENDRAKNCFYDKKCIKTPTHPLGIPAWKMLSVHWWAGESEHPLGHKWTLSPENYGAIDPKDKAAANTYLGYSIERTCMNIPITPATKRPKQIYVLAKKAEYFVGGGYAYPGLSFEPPHELHGLKVLAGVREGSVANMEAVPKYVKNLGRLDQKAFYEVLGKSRALVGLGHPLWSPSPYDALCMGVPFINPIQGWDRKDPDNRVRWSTQHDGLKYLNPPYVYNVKMGDIDGFWDAVKGAVQNPIERYIVPEMTMDALSHRLGAIVETDWKSEAENLLDERVASGQGKLFEL